MPRLAFLILFATAVAIAAPAQAADTPRALTPVVIFADATLLVKLAMAGLVAAALACLVFLVMKLSAFAALNRNSARFVAAFRTTTSLNEIGRLAAAGEFKDNPLALMAAAATREIELSRQAGLPISGAERAPMTARIGDAVQAIQAGLGRRLSGSQTFMAATAAAAPLIGLFAAAYCLMNGFIGIANSNVTPPLTVVAPGVVEALFVAALGLLAAAMAVIFRKTLAHRASAYAVAAGDFSAELTNAVSRQLGVAA